MTDNTPTTSNYLGESVNNNLTTTANIVITNQLFQSTQEGLVAHAGGGQGSATPVTSMCARFTTVATGADSAILPAAVRGLEITVINAGAAALAVFPDVGSTMNGALNTALSVPINKTAIFFTTLAGSWHSILSA